MGGCVECGGSSKQPNKVSEDQLTIAIAGNPNCGKSALFNNFTGIRQKTGNWPGVTVDRKEGYFELDNTSVRVVDMPGIYSLDASSLDEQVSRDYLLSREADLLINVLDASNLERNLYLTVQLLEMGVPVVIALNMMDVARKRGIKIDIERFEKEIGCPVIPIVAVSNEGMTALKSAILDVAQKKKSAGFSLSHDEIIETAANELCDHIQAEQANKRWIAIKLLEGDSHYLDLLDQSQHKVLLEQQAKIASRADEDAELLIADTRFSHAHTLAQNVTKVQGRVDKTFSDKIDNIVIGRWTGIPLFLMVMYLMFLFTINVGGAFIDFFDGLSNTVFVEGFGELITSVGLPDWARLLLADGIGGGIQIVSTFIPIITALYLFLSFLEDSGYMARAAFVMDRSMRTIGLPGKAFVPLIVGFGCNVPAIMATRTLESERERKLTILMNPFMSCGARLPVYALFAAAFFPVSGQNIVFALYLIGIAVAILTGLLMKKTLLPGESSGFLMELPPYHIPTLKGIMLRAWDRVRLFIKEAGQVIIVMVVVLNVLNSIGTDGSFGNEDSDKSVLSEVSRQLTPAFAPMGIQSDNWPAIVGIFSGILAKEVVVGTLDNLYAQIAQDDMSISPESFDFWQGINSAVQTVPDNLSALKDSLLDPLGLNVGDLSNTQQAATEQGVNAGIFGAMNERFDGKAGAFAYLLFVLLYFPCVATIGAIKREAGRNWAMFVAFWTTFIAYSVASSFYQIATYSEHPVSSLVTLSILIALFLAIMLVLKNWDKLYQKNFNLRSES